MSQKQTAIRIKTASLEEMPFLLASAEKEGWNPGINDAKPFHGADPNGFFIGEVDGRRMGCISAVAYDNFHGFIGFYIVSPEFRSRGFGLCLWNHAMDYLGGRSIGLDAVEAQVANYEKSGFMPFYKSCRYRGKGEKRSTNGLTPVREVPFDLLNSYDTAIFGLDRTRFLQEWISMENSLTLAKIEKGQLLGYGTIRSCAVGYKIGPLFAQDERVAEELFDGLSSHAHNEPLFFDVPKVNSSAVEIAVEKGLEPLFEEVRMYNRPPAISRLTHIFGVTSFELG